MNKAEDLLTLKELAYSVGAMNYDKDVVDSTPEPDKIGRAVAKIIDLERQKEDMIVEYFDRRNRIEAQICNVPNTNYYNVLYRKFILGKNLDAIAKEMTYSLSQVKRYYGKALDMFEKMYGEMYLNDRFDLFFKNKNQNEPK